MTRKIWAGRRGVFVSASPGNARGEAAVPHLLRGVDDLEQLNDIVVPHALQDLDLPGHPLHVSDLCSGMASGGGWHAAPRNGKRTSLILSFSRIFTATCSLVST